MGQSKNKDAFKVTVGSPDPGWGRGYSKIKGRKLDRGEGLFYERQRVSVPGNGAAGDADADRRGYRALVIDSGCGPSPALVLQLTGGPWPMQRSFGDPWSLGKGEDGARVV